MDDWVAAIGVLVIVGAPLVAVSALMTLLVSLTRPSRRHQRGKDLQ